MRVRVAGVAMLAVVCGLGAVSPGAAQGRLAAAPDTECAALQALLQPAVPRPFSRSTGEVRYFSQNFDATTRSCVIRATGMLNQFARAPNYWEDIERRLRRAGWRQDPHSIADGGGGQALGFRKGDRYLSAMFEEDDGGMCDPEDPNATGCDLPPERTRVTVEIGLARAAPAAAPRRR